MNASPGAEVFIDNAVEPGRNEAAASTAEECGMTDLGIVKDLFAAFADADEAAIRRILAPDVVWAQNRGFPGGGVHHGVEAVLANVFGKFARDWEGWTTRATEFLDAGSAVVVLGEYAGRYKASGRHMTAAFAHVYRLTDGRVVRFTQYTDTAMIASAVFGGAAASGVPDIREE